jgi:hypothetical protein
MMPATHRWFRRQMLARFPRHLLRGPETRRRFFAHLYRAILQEAQATRLDDLALVLRSLRRSERGLDPARFLTDLVEKLAGPERIEELDVRSRSGGRRAAAPPWQRVGGGGSSMPATSFPVPGNPHR